MDDKNLDTAIYIYDRIRKALESLQITATRSNLDTTLGCIQLCDKGIAALKAEKEEKHSKATTACSAVSSAKDAKEVKEAS